MFTKVWVVFIISIFLFLNIFNMFVIYKNSDFKSSAKELDSSRAMLEKNIDDIDEKIGFILRQKAVAEEIYANNIILKDSMKNLFDLVPDQITLNKVIMEKDLNFHEAVKDYEKKIILEALEKSNWVKSKQSFHLELYMFI